MIIKYSELRSTDFVFTDVVAYRRKLDDVDKYNFESGRTKHLIYYQISNVRTYYYKNDYICTINPGDIISLPHGVKYRSFNINKEVPSDGIGISFNLYTPDGEPIYFEEGIEIIKNDSFGKYLKRFKKILYSVMNPAENTLLLKAELYSLLYNLFKSDAPDFDEAFGDIKKAISILENNPELNHSTKELADMCLMSESSFLRKFKEYSGGIAPIKYRNNIRLMLAEEMANSPLNMNEIAEQLGFYDASHLCKIYKQEKGYTLKKKDY